MAIKKVLIEVYGGTAVGGGWGCSSAVCGPDSCGPTVSMEDAVAELIKELSQKYGNKVEVKYTDTDQKGLGAYPRVGQVIRMGYSLPIIMINGEPRLAGGIDLKQIQAILDTIV